MSDLTKCQPASEQGLYDIFVIGGGINGAGIARDAAGRDLKVAICEKNDFASGTSSASTKLIHGGLRYLENYEFGLVRKALIERDVLLQNAPHIIWPLRFVLPHDKQQRPAWMLRLGLFLYDHLGGRSRLPISKSIDLQGAVYGNPLKSSYKVGFEYSDCWVDDARLVILNIIGAQEKGATILSRTKFLSANRDGYSKTWNIKVQKPCGEEGSIRARAIVNAAGPWVTNVAGEIQSRSKKTSASLRLVQGSHVVVPKIYNGDHAYIFQNPDGRVQFAIPYEGRFTLLGTTDVSFEGDIDKIYPSANECDYIIRMANEYFATELSIQDICYAYSGVRPLYDDSDEKSVSAVTRDYVFELDGDVNVAPVLTIFGGKITTYRVLAEKALTALKPILGRIGPNWTERTPLPGGDMPDADFDLFLSRQYEIHPRIDRSILYRLARQYGTRASHIIGDAKTTNDLGRSFGEGLTEAELRYLVDEEWANTVEDILWRRTKLGLHIDEQELASLQDYWNGSPFATAVSA